MKQMAIWDDVIPAEERRKMEEGGMGVSLNGFGNKPALVIVDMVNAFVDDSFPLADSSVGKPAVKSIQRLLKIAREKKTPIFHVTAQWKDNQVERGLWKRTTKVNEALQHPQAYDFVDELKPLPDEPVVVRNVPSSFHSSNLLSMLIQENVDTLIVMGMVTSGCVYATALDGFQYGFKVVIPEEGVADRSETAHKVSLFSFHMKYGDVLGSAEVEKYLEKL